MTRPNTLSALSGLSLLALAASAQAQEDWTKHFRIGMSFGLNIKTDFRTSGTFGVSAVGQPIPGQNHTYDDGFVRVDDTGNAVPFGSTSGATANWGYQSGGQYDAGAQTLAFHGTSSYNTAGFTSRDDAPQLGFDMAYGGSFRKWERLAIGWEFGFNWTLINNKDRSALTATTVQVEDIYPTGGTTIPGAPYTGGFDSAGRPVIDDAPTRTETFTTGTVTGSRGLDASLYQFRLGPMIRWEMVPRWTLNGSVGGAFGLFDADFDYNERIITATTSTTNRGKFGDFDTTYGGYAGVVIMYDTGHMWEAYLGTHFVTMSDVTVSGPGRSAKTHLGAALYLTAGINWSF